MAAPSSVTFPARESASSTRGEAVLSITPRKLPRSAFSISRSSGDASNGASVNRSRGSSIGRNRESISTPLSSRMPSGERESRYSSGFLRGFDPIPWRRAITNAATCSQAASTLPQSHSHSASFVYSETRGVKGEPGTATRATTSSPSSDSRETAPPRARVTPFDQASDEALRRTSSKGSVTAPQ